MTGLAQLLAARRPIDLAELEAQSALLRRTDRKYLLTTEQAALILGELDPKMRVLEIEGNRLHRYTSTYFDTAALRCFHDAATRRRRRFKVRTRCYADSGQQFLEVKTRGPRGQTVKHRRARTGPASVLAHDDVTFVRDVLSGDGALRPVSVRPAGPLDLRPTLRTDYLRLTLQDMAGGARVTLDYDLVWSRIPSRTIDGDAPAVPGSRAAGVVVLETKGSVTGTATDQLLRRRGLRPVSLSKYATGLAALEPPLSRHRWQRVLDALPEPSAEPARSTSVGAASELPSHGSLALRGARSADVG